MSELRVTDPELVDTKRVSDGRLYLGDRFDGETVKFAILEVVEDE